MRGSGLLARSIVTKNLVLFVAILLAAMVPLAVQYHRDSRDYEIQNTASKLEVFAERGAAWIDVAAIATLTGPEHRQTPAYEALLATLNRIKREFEVDNAVVMRREPDATYSYVAIDHDGFDIGQLVHIHALFPATYRATEETWQAAEMMHSRLFGGHVEGEQYAQFLQINTPLKLEGRVVAILMLNKFADPVAAAVRAKTLAVIGLSAGLVVAGLILFGFASARMLRPLTALTAAAGRVARGDLEVTVPATRSADEVGRLARAFQGMVAGLRQRDFIRETFGRYVSHEIVETILGSPDGLRLGGDRREVTFLVADLRGFSVLAEALPPEEVLRILNGYLGRAVEILMRYRATVDEFQGDGILAFFGAPLAAVDDAERAVACAIEMQNALAALNAEQRDHGLSELEMGIGINTGQVIVGNIGSDVRTKYGAVGAAINVAYRIESQTVGGQVLIGPETYARVGGILDVRGARPARLKGIPEPVVLHEVVGVRGRYGVTLTARSPVPLRSLNPALPVVCRLLDGAVVTDTGIAGHLVRASTEAAELRLQQAIEPRSTIQIEMDGRPEPDALGYARVTSVEQADGTVSVSVSFTALPPRLRRLVEPLAEASAP